jgi:hypothetical protein
MPISFKPAITAIFYKRTPTEDLVPCVECGGPNLMGKVSQKVDCTACSQTGYQNYWTGIALPVYYTPRAFTRWTGTEGGLAKFGDAQIKLDNRYIDIVNDSKFVNVMDQDWNFQRAHIPGQAFGQQRIVLAISRK